MRRNREINLKVSDCEIWREKERKPTLALGFCFIFVFVVLKIFFFSSVGQRRGGIGAGAVSPGKGF